MLSPANHNVIRLTRLYVRRAEGAGLVVSVAFKRPLGANRPPLDTPPQLTPLLVSNPGDCFDPADPWYDCLDPSWQGLPFSRRYGFVMDTATDALPAGVAIWIRKLSGSPGLKVYRYRSGAVRLWDPIFGTAGVTNAFQCGRANGRGLSL